ncbi:MAG: hypothetical protein KG029_09325 [Bacteroidetes bacterium]|nr:hypothetical protein [Bacteroidota bacterium]
MNHFGNSTNRFSNSTNRFSNGRVSVPTISKPAMGSGNVLKIKVSGGGYVGVPPDCIRGY